MSNITHIINRLEEIIIALLLAGMTVITFTQVVVRYINSHFWHSAVGLYLLEQFPWLKPLTAIHMVWALELTQYLFAWLVLFGMSYGVRIGAHISVDAVTRLLSPLWQRILAILATLLAMLYCVLLLIGAVKYVSTIYTLGIQAESLPIQQWIFYLILPIGLIWLWFRFAQLMYQIIIKGMTVISAEETHPF